MRPLTLGAAIFSLIVVACQEPIEKLEHILVYPVETATRKTKREASSNYKKSEFNHFVEEKLIQHTQALEHVVKLLQTNEETTKQLVNALSHNVVKPKLPEKIEVHQTRRSEVESDKKHSIVTFAKSIPKHGAFLKNIILADFYNDEDPLPIVEHRVSDLESRRSIGGKPTVVPNNLNDNKPSPWCAVAVLCHRTMNPVCGYDDDFGYGKFDDICHMLQVNCYWKYNFALVPSCKPTL